MKATIVFLIILACTSFTIYEAAIRLRATDRYLALIVFTNVSHGRDNGVGRTAQMVEEPDRAIWCAPSWQPIEICFEPGQGK